MIIINQRSHHRINGITPNIIWYALTIIIMSTIGGRNVQHDIDGSTDKKYLQDKQDSTKLSSTQNVIPSDKSTLESRKKRVTFSTTS